MNTSHVRIYDRYHSSQAVRFFFVGLYLLGLGARADVIFNDDFTVNSLDKYETILDVSGNTGYSDEGRSYLLGDQAAFLRTHRKNNTSSINYSVRIQQSRKEVFPLAADSPVTISLEFGSSANIPTPGGGVESVVAAEPDSGPGNAQVRMGVVSSLAAKLGHSNSLCTQVTGYSNKVNIQLRWSNSNAKSADLNNNNGWSADDRVTLRINGETATVSYCDKSTGVTTEVLKDVPHGLNYSTYLGGAYAAFDVGNSGGINPGQEFNIKMVVDSFKVEADPIHPPSEIWAVETSGTSADISWNACSTAASYNVYRDGVLLDSSSATSYSDAGPLDKHCSYEYTIQSVNAQGVASALSDFAVFAYRRFPFVIPWDDASTGATDMSDWSPAPADKWVTVSNGRLVADGVPIRFLGVNLAFAACLPPSDDPVHGNMAEKIAARFAKLGINCVRMHRIDAPTPSGILQSDNRSLDAAALRKFDYFISRLKSHGIYVDLNLQVGRAYPTFSSAGFSNGKFKSVDLYMPEMIDLQKEFASDLLSHVNEYTGLSYAKDPVVAFVEINNENSLIDGWRKSLFESGIDQSYITELNTQWNSWLENRYADNVALSTAWAPSLGSAYGNALISNGNFSSEFGPPWYFQVKSPAQATKSIISGEAPDGSNIFEVNVTATSSIPNTVDLYYAPLSVTQQPYTVAFWAKAETERDIIVRFIRNHGLYQVIGKTFVTLGTQWQKHTLILSPSATDTNVRLEFAALGTQQGTISFANIALTSGNTLMGPVYAAPEGNLGSEILTNGDFSAGFTAPWTLQTAASAQASPQVLDSEAPDGSDALELNITTASTEAWGVQFYEAGRSVVKDQPYTISFWAKAETKRAIQINLQTNSAPKSLANTSVQVDTEWKLYTILLMPNETNADVRFLVGQMGLTTGKLWFARFSMKSGAPGIGLPPGEALGAVDLLHPSDFMTRSRAARRDWQRFLWETEKNYWTTMRGHVRDTLDSESLIIGTQTAMSPCLLQADFDVVDTHAYWQHPQFPNATWASTDWYFKNLPMAGDTGGGTLPNVASTRVAGKPFICTEYNHSSPNTFSGESLLLAASYASMQGWDGIFVYNYLHTTAWTREFFSQWFETAQEPAKLVSFPAAKAILQPGILTQGSARATASVRLDDAIEMIGTCSWPFGTKNFGIPADYAVRFPESIQSTEGVTQVSYPIINADPEITSANGELIWDTENKVCILNSPKAKFITGRTNGQSFDFTEDGIVITPGASIQTGNWATIALFAKTGSSLASTDGTFLLSATGYTDNHRMTWKSGMGPEAVTSSVGDQWGKSPVLLEGIDADITLPIPADKVEVWALDPCGQRESEVPVSDASGKANFQISRDYLTPWYEVITIP